MKRLLPLLLTALLLLSACGQGESRTLQALLDAPVDPLPEPSGNGLLPGTAKRCPSRAPTPMPTRSVSRPSMG